MKPLLTYYIIFGIGYLAYIFQTGFVYWIILTAMNFVLISLTRTNKLFPYVLWVINLATLYCNEQFRGYGFAWVSKSLQFMDDEMVHAPVRWNIIFNMTILRIISFGMDFHWAFTSSKTPVKVVASI